MNRTNLEHCEAAIDEMVSTAKALQRGNMPKVDRLSLVMATLSEVAQLSYKELLALVAIATDRLAQVSAE